MTTQVSRLAAAALAVREALEKLDAGASLEIGLRVRVSLDEETDAIRTVGRIVADVEKRYGISIELDYGR